MPSIAEIRRQTLDEPFDNYLQFSASRYPLLFIPPNSQIIVRRIYSALVNKMTITYRGELETVSTKMNAESVQKI